MQHLLAPCHAVFGCAICRRRRPGRLGRYRSQCPFGRTPLEDTIGAGSHQVSIVGLDVASCSTYHSHACCQHSSSSFALFSAPKPAVRCPAVVIVWFFGCFTSIGDLSRSPTKLQAAPTIVICRVSTYALVSNFLPPTTSTPSSLAFRLYYRSRAEQLYSSSSRASPH